MRLTLRTLLAWLDGALVPEEQRSLGDRVAGSTMATGLTQRILESVGRADLDAPRVESWGTPDDANFVADYLDNRLQHDQLEWFERICLQSEPRLAEVADCHGALVDCWRSGGVGGISTSAPAPTRERLKELVHRAAAERGLRGPTSPEPPRSEPPRSVGDAADRRAGQGHAASVAVAPDTGGKAAFRVPPAAHSAPRQAAVRHAASGHSPAAAPSSVSPARRQRRWTKAGRESSDRLSAAVAVVLLLAAGGAAVAWLNFGGRGVGPRRAAVQGIVTFDGALLENGVVVLLPAGDTKGPTAGGTVSKGRFSIAAASGPVLGRYRVEIKAMRKTGREAKGLVPVGGRKERGQSEQFIPARYNTASEIEVEIKPGRNTLRLELLPAPAPAAKPGAASKSPRIVVGRDRLPSGHAAAGLGGRSG